MNLLRSLSLAIAAATVTVSGCGADATTALSARGGGSGTAGASTSGSGGSHGGGDVGRGGATVDDASGTSGGSGSSAFDASVDARSLDAAREANAAEDKAAASILDGYVIAKPCVDTFKPTATPGGHGACCCEEKPENENQHHVERFGGDPNVTYDVTLRIRGVFERYWYEGGTLDATSTVFYAGGVPTIHSAKAPNTGLKPAQGACKIHPPETDNQFALPFKVPPEINPTDGCFNGFNIFALVVGSPKKSYYLNDTTDFDNIDRQPHWAYKNDYTITIPIRGGSQLDFFTIDGDHHQVTNDGTMSVAGPVKVAQPYNGNFVQFDVVGVERAK